MRRLIQLLILLFFLPLFSFAQSDNAKKIGEANDLLAKKDVRHALAIFRKLHAQVQMQDTLYPWVAKGLFESLYAGTEEKKSSTEWEALIDLTNEAMQILEGDKDYLPAGLQSMKYWLYENLVMGNMGMGRFLAATGPRMKLYDAYEQKLLPKGLDKEYTFEVFKYEDLDIRGKEYYKPENLEPNTLPTKQVYYVYSREGLRKDSTPVYTMETILLDEKKKANEPNSYVFVKKVIGKKKKVEMSISSANSYTDPVNLEKLHKTAIECLTGVIKFDSDGGGKK